MVSTSSLLTQILGQESRVVLPEGKIESFRVTNLVHNNYTTT